MHSYRFKQGVSADGLKDPILKVLELIGHVYKSVVNQPAVITSAAEGFDGDGVHKKGSFHYKGLAVDIRIKDAKTWEVFPKTTLATLQYRLNIVLNPNPAKKEYDIVLEGDHYHIEYDPK